MKLFDLLEEFVEDVIDRNFDDVLVDSIKEELLHNLLIEIKLEPEEFESLGKDGIKAKRILDAAKEFLRKKEEMLRLAN